MAPLQLLIAAAAFSALSSSASSASSAQVEESVEVPAAVQETPSPSPSVAAFEAACPLPNTIMTVLNVLETVGVTRVDRTSKLVSHTGVSDTERLPVRIASWASASEPRPMPILYSRMMQLDF
jgi:hypothetical protein